MRRVAYVAAVMGLVVCVAAPDSRGDTSETTVVIIEDTPVVEELVSDGPAAPLDIVPPPFPGRPFLQSFYSPVREVVLFFVPVLAILCFTIVGLHQKLAAREPTRPWSWYCLCLGIASSVLGVVFAVLDLTRMVFDSMGHCDLRIFIFAGCRYAGVAVLGALAALLLGPMNAKEHGIKK